VQSDPAVDVEFGEERIHELDSVEPAMQADYHTEVRRFLRIVALATIAVGGFCRATRM
jgi:hypothetical protein